MIIPYHYFLFGQKQGQIAVYSDCPRRDVVVVRYFALDVGQIVGPLIGATPNTDFPALLHYFTNVIMGPPDYGGFRTT